MNWHNLDFIPTNFGKISPNSFFMDEPFRKIKLQKFELLSVANSIDRFEKILESVDLLTGSKM